MEKSILFEDSDFGKALADFKFLKLTGFLFCVGFLFFGLAAKTQAATGQVQFIGTPIDSGNFSGQPLSSLTDNDFTTNWAGATADGSWAGFDLGTPCTLTDYRFAPLSGNVTADYETSTVGGQFQSGTSGTFSSSTTYDTIPQFPYYPRYQYSDRPITDSTPAEFWRFFGASGTYGGHLTELRLIGNPCSGATAQPVAPTIAPWGGRFTSGSTTVTMSSLTTSASIYYTTDGTTPTNTSGTLYTGSFTLNIPNGGVTLKAVAYDPTLSTPLSDVVGGNTYNAAHFVNYGYAPDDNWYDNTGNLIEAHSGGILDNTARDGKYYWYGSSMDFYTGAHSNQDSRFNSGVDLYSSTDLYNWTNMGNILPVPSGSGWDQIIRPHVVYDASTHKYVLWGHALNVFSRANDLAVVATADNPAGPWTWQDTTIKRDDSSCGTMDASIFQDTDGTTYDVCAISSLSGFVVSKLSADDLESSGVFTTVSVSPIREAPVMFRRGSVYFLIEAAGEYYDHTQESDERYMTSTSPLGPWSTPTTLFSSDPIATLYNSQSSFVLKVPGKVDGYVYGADYWYTGDIYQSRQDWLPLSFPTAGTLSVSTPATWDLSTFANASTADTITSFSFGLSGETDTINPGAISVTVPYGTNMTSLTPTIGVSSGATISPTSGTAENFTSPVAYTVTAQDAETVQTYTVSVSIAPNTDPTLSALTMSSGTLSPAFSSGTTSYTAIVGNAVTGVTVTPTANQGGSSTIKVNGTTVASGSSSLTIPLNVGFNSITIVVTAPNGVTTKTYTLAVTRSLLWLSGWSYRKAITISKTNVASELSYFPLLVSIAETGGSSTNIGYNLSDKTLGGYDIRFTDAAGNILPYERESFSDASNNLVANFWVQIPIINSVSDTFSTAFYVYYGNNSASSSDWTAATSTLANCTSITNSQCTWYENGANNYKGVWHFGTPSSLSLFDSTANGNTLTNHSSVTAATGTVGGAANFSGSNWLSNTNLATTFAGATNATLEAWVFRSSTSNKGLVGFPHVINTTANDRYDFAWESNLIYFQAENGGSASFPNASLSGTGWNYIAMSYNGSLSGNSRINAVINGTTTTLTTGGTSPTSALVSSTSLSEFDVGRDNEPFGTVFSTGLADEVRLSSVSRSTAWISFENCNMMSATSSNCIIPSGGYASNELTFASQEIAPSNNDTVTSSIYTVSSLSGGSGTITNIPYGTSKATFEAAITKGQANQAWTDTGIHDPVLTGDTLVVLAQDGATQSTYTATVNASADATLSNVVISQETLTPSFSSGQTSYTASVANGVTSVTVTPTAHQSNATITVNGAAVLSGVATGPISLSVGSNTILTVATAQDGITIDTYTITVNRAQPVAIAPNAPPAPVVGVAGSYAPPFIPAPPATTSGSSTIAQGATTAPAGSSSMPSLQSQLNTLLAELTVLQSQAGVGGSSPAVASFAYNFTRNLSYGMTGADVTALQNYLILQAKGPDANKLQMHGVTKNFATLTYNALVEFQKSVGIIPASGYFGPITRNWVNQ